MGQQLSRGRDAFGRRAWSTAHAELAGAASEPPDLELLAVAAHLLGRDAESVRAWTRAHLGWVRLGESDRAVRCAFWLAIALLLRGEPAQAAGWLAQAQRLVEQRGGDGAGRGFLLVPAFLSALGGGEKATAAALADEIVGVAQRFDDADLLAFGMLSRGQAALAAGDVDDGMRLLDEVMVSVLAVELSPITTGIVYCAVIEACLEAADLRRAGEWTAALHGWCTDQPDLVPYRGQCLVHRSQILQAHGRWSEAVTEVEQARRRLSEPAHPALGLALYQRGELHRLRGEPDEAERAYRAAGRHGVDPAPGLALLRVAQGKLAAAVGAVRRMVEESHGRLNHPTMLAAAVDVLLESGDVAAAEAARAELARIADVRGTPLLLAMAEYATGCVLLATGTPAGALKVLRRAGVRWRELGMPYDAARAGVQVALACRALGDHDTAALELDTARATFAQLGARHDLARTERLADPTGGGRGRLTARECEVLRLVAAGRTNREIATELVISEHTVARHLQNIFAKLDVTSRAAATAYAYEHGVV